MEISDKIPVYPTAPSTDIQQQPNRESLPTYVEATSFQQPNINTFQPINPTYPPTYLGSPRVVAVTAPSTCYVETHCPDECHEDWILYRRRAAILALSFFIISVIVFCIIFFSIRSTSGF
uniref:Membrane protein UL56 n=1 Tax=Strongyloides papillosus TaxID=174720 RepID=A0A0N5C581_STREA